MKKLFTLVILGLFFTKPLFAQTIFTAAQSGDINAVKFLLNKGISPDSKNAEGFTPLMIAVKYHQSRVANYLLEKDAAIDLKNNKGNTALMLACAENDETFVKALILHHANITLSNKHSYTALDYAIETGNEKLIQLIKQQKATS